jgi:ssDNA thymidine ADP-ribosyltransferase, DarT
MVVRLLLSPLSHRQEKDTLARGREQAFHITHLENLSNICEAGVLWSDAKRIELGLESSIVGMSSIKARRLTLPVQCHPATTVGEYVPFYFCPRSIMLYILHMANHPEIAYRGGQGPIVHMVADLRATVAWATSAGRRWALTNRNAGTLYADFYADLGDLERINWSAVEALDFRSPVVKDGKQAEFLIHESMPWELIEEIGVLDSSVSARAAESLRGAAHRPPILVKRAWYF